MRRLPDGDVGWLEVGLNKRSPPRRDDVSDGEVRAYGFARIAVAQALGALPRTRTLLAGGLGLLVGTMLARENVRVSAQYTSATSGVAETLHLTAFERRAWALESNPAALAQVPSWEASVMHRQSHVSEPGSRSADAGYLVLPLPLALRAGMSVQHHRPNEADSYGLLAWGLAAAVSPRLALGFTVRHLASRASSDLAGVTSLDVGLLAQLSSSWSASLALRDALGPTELGARRLDLPASARAGLDWHPGFWSAVNVNVEGAVDTQGQIGGRAWLRAQLGWALALAVGGHTEVLADTRLWGLSAQAEFAYGPWALGAGAQLPNTRESPAADWYVSAGLRGSAPVMRETSGVRTPGRGARVTLTLKDSGPRATASQVHKIERALADPRIGGILLEIERDMSWSDAQEFRGLLLVARARGVKTACSFSTATKTQFYACTAADKRLIDPAGFLSLGGIASERLLFGEAARRMGLRTSFLRIGRFKSAPETWTRSSLTEPAREQSQSQIDQIWSRFLADWAFDSGETLGRLTAWLSEGLMTAGRALELGLVSGVIDDEDPVGSLGEGFPSRSVALGASTTARPWPRRIAVLTLDGTMVDGKSATLPLIGVNTTGALSFVEACERARRDPSVAAVVLRVDSPGGSALAADKIWRALRRLGQAKPLVASIGSLAASAGYYAASAASTIVANPSSLVGSIGIFFGKVDFAPLFSRIGIGVETQTRGELAGARSLYRPLRAREREVLADRLRDWYALFLDRVAEGRGQTPARIDAVARGRVLTADAPEAGILVDKIGGLHTALSEARALAGLNQRAPVVDFTVRPAGLGEHLLGSPNERRLGVAIAEDAGNDSLAALGGVAEAALVGLGLPTSLVNLWLALSSASNNVPLALELDVPELGR